MDRQTVDLPDVCTIYTAGALAFRADLKKQLFPVAAADLQFLPIEASGEPWLLLNCMRAVSGIDPESSEVLRGLTGEIFLATRIRVTDERAEKWDVFTLEDSNRSQLIVTEEFVSRVRSLNLKGVAFRNAGEID